MPFKAAQIILESVSGSAWIEQGRTSLNAKVAQRVTRVEVQRIVLSIGGTEACHFQTWHDKAGNAIHFADVIDPVTRVSVTFPDLNSLHRLMEKISRPTSSCPSLRYSSAGNSLRVSSFDPRRRR